MKMPRHYWKLQYYFKNSDIYETNAEQNCQKMLCKLVGLMSDVASVMKSFDKMMNTEKIFCKQMSVEFLHCNARLLLGLSTEADKIIKQL